MGHRGPWKLGTLLGRGCGGQHLAADGPVAYTSPAPRVVSFILDRVGWSGPATVGARLLDPACGSGAFLVEAARRAIEAHRAQAHAEGHAEIPPNRVQEVLNKLRDCIVGSTSTRSPAPWPNSTCSCRCWTWWPTASATASRVGSTGSAKWDLFVPFVALGLHLLRRPDGRLGMIVSNGLETVLHAKRLREHLTLTAAVREVHFFEPRVQLFEEAAVRNTILHALGWRAPPALTATIVTAPIGIAWARWGLTIERPNARCGSPRRETAKPWRRWRRQDLPFCCARRTLPSPSAR